jgi:hypothetical protein
VLVIGVLLWVHGGIKGATSVSARGKATATHTTHVRTTVR